MHIYPRKKKVKVQNVSEIDMASRLFAYDFLSANDLRKLKLSQLSLHEKVAIGERSCLAWHSSITALSNKRYKRSFNSECYTKKTWLCVCEVRSALSCFPLLVLGGEEAKDIFTIFSRLRWKMNLALGLILKQDCLFATAGRVTSIFMN